MKLSSFLIIAFKYSTQNKFARIVQFGQPHLSIVPGELMNSILLLPLLLIQLYVNGMSRKYKGWDGRV